MSTPNHDTELEDIYIQAYLNGVDHEKRMDEFIAEVNAYLYKQTLELIPNQHENTDVPTENLNAQEDGEVIGYNQAVELMRKAAAERWGQE